MSNQKFGWCFIGSGSITKRVMRDLSRYAEISYLAVVYSPNPAHREALAAEYGAKAASSAEEAICDSSVDAVYIATPHTLHRACAELALRLGKPVLCEKPLTDNAEDGARLAALAREKGLYLAEGMWTRFNPVVRRAVEWVQSGRIGEVRTVRADFSGSIGFDPSSRLFDPKLGGGALLDIGIYPVSFAQLIYGDERPVSVSAVGNPAPSGVDRDCAIQLKYACGGTAQLYTSFSTDLPSSYAVIGGTQGHIVIEPPFWCARRATLHSRGTVETFDLMPGDYEGFQFEFDAVAREILAGRTESDVIPLEASLRCLEIIDAARAAIKE